MANKQIVGIEEFSTVVSNILKEYGEAVFDAVDEAVPEVAKETAKQIKSNAKSFGWSAEYSNGWKNTTTKRRGSVTSVVHNANKWQIAHLLEYSHPMPQGGVSKAYSHIAEPNNWAQEEIEKRIEEKIKDGL